MSQGFVNPQPITLPVPVADGGTGTTNATAYAVQCGGTTSTGAHQSIASVGTSGQVLTSNGAGALPTFTTLQSGNIKAWVNFNGTGAVAIRESGNVTSITDNGTGDYTMNFTTALADANYCALYTASDGSNTAVMGGLQSNTTSGATVLCVSRLDTAGLIDVQFISAAVLR
jgi:hypothetical protein